MAGEMGDDGGYRGVAMKMKMMMRMMMKMKTLLCLLPVWVVLLPLPALAEEKAKGPTVEVYDVRRAELRAPVAVAKSSIMASGVIMEISNPTEQTYYVRGLRIESPAYDIEVKRGEKWLAKPVYDRGEWIESFSLKPGAKMLVTVLPPMNEPVSRLRFYFFTTSDEKTARVVTVRSREFEAKELHDLERVDKKAPEKTEGFEELRSDEQMNELLEEEWKKEQLR